MPTYNLSAFAGAGAQFFDDNGAPLVGGKVYTYASGTTTPRATYTTSAGTVANSNPIILDAAGRTPNEIWLIAGSLYKFIVRTSTDVLIGTYDGVPSINDSFSTYNLLSSVSGTNTITATATPTLTSYQAGATYSFIAANTNTGATTISIDGLVAKSITKNGSVALTAGDIQAGKMMLIEYDGTVFQLMNNIVYGSALTNATINSLTSPLTVANGGTGAGTFTANAVLLGNNTAAFQTVAPGTAGNLLTSNGTTWQSVAPSVVPASTIDVQTFTSSGTWTKPAAYDAASRVLIQCWGGGGSGARTAGGFGGGGGGGYNEAWVTLSTLGATVTATVGAGGAAVTTFTNGNTGGTTTFGIVSAYGGGPGGTDLGGGGGAQLSAGLLGSGGGGLAGSPFAYVSQGTGGDTVTIAMPGYNVGGGGGSSQNGSGNYVGGASVWGGGGGGGAGAGGASSFGGAGGAGSVSSSGTAGTQPGGGGGGTATGTASGAGAAGQIIVTVFPA